MNQLYRALHMPPGRLLRKLTGEKEIYTIAVRPVPTAEGADPLPALGAAPYIQLPGREGFWFADPLLYRRGGHRYLFAEAMDLATGKGRIEVCELQDDGKAGDWQGALEGGVYLSFPVGAGPAVRRGCRTVRRHSGGPHPGGADAALQRNQARQPALCTVAAVHPAPCCLGCCAAARHRSAGTGRRTL